MICIFTNESYFSYLLARETLTYFHSEIGCVVFSKRATSNCAGILEIYRRTNHRYFTYRTIVQMITLANDTMGKKSINTLCKKYGIQSIATYNVCRDIPKIQRDRLWRLGITFNFDQILNGEMIGLFELGVINVHASKLPEFRGISPALWAFARGDDEIWVTIYQLDSGIDTGPILRQFKINVEKGDSAFSLYERVCEESGRVLAEVLKEYLNGTLRPQEIDSRNEGSYFSWPDEKHLKLMKRNKRKYINMKDIIRALK